MIQLLKQRKISLAIGFSSSLRNYNMDIERQDKTNLERCEKFDECMRYWDGINSKIDKILALIAEISNSRNSDSTIAAPTHVAEDSNSDSVQPSPASAEGVAIQHLHHTTVSP